MSLSTDEKMPAQRTVALNQLAPSEWFKSSEKSSFWLRIYSSLHIDHATFIEKARKFSEPLPTLHKPIKIGFGHLHNFKIPFFHFFVFANEQGTTQINFDTNERQLPNGNYVFMASPHRIDGIDGDEGVSRKNMDVASCLIAAHLGPNFMREKLFEGQVECAQGGQFHSYSDAIKVPQNCEGPFLDPQNWLDCREELDALVKLSDPHLKQRIELAIQIFWKAFSESQPLLNYWIAIEILCNGKWKHIRKAIIVSDTRWTAKKVDYGAPDIIKKWRDNLVHQGVYPLGLSADVEIYIQAIFKDILRSKLRLANKGYAFLVEHMQGIDLTGIGLRKNS
jgi:hypothetical protein